MTAVATTSVGAAQTGRTRITTKALDRVVSAVTAEALRVDAAHVRVDLADRDGVVALSVSSPIRIVSLGRVHADSAVVRRTGGPIVDRATQAQETIRRQVSAITGSAIGWVTVRLTGVTIQPVARVQ